MGDLNIAAAELCKNERKHKRLSTNQTLGFFSSVVKETKTEEEKISAKVWDLQQVPPNIIKSWHLKKKNWKTILYKTLFEFCDTIKILIVFWGPNPDLQSNRREQRFFAHPSCQAPLENLCNQPRCCLTNQVSFQVVTKTGSKLLPPAVESHRGKRRRKTGSDRRPSQRLVWTSAATGVGHFWMNPTEF